MKGVPLVIFLDAAVDLEPGEIRLARVRPQPHKASTHHMRPGQLLSLAQQVNGKETPGFLISGGITEMDLFGNADRIRRHVRVEDGSTGNPASAPANQDGHRQAARHHQRGGTGSGTAAGGGGKVVTLDSRVNTGKSP